jgi:hypothetical protein
MGRKGNLSFFVTNSIIITNKQFCSGPKIKAIRDPGTEREISN